ncbi:hypothetical protein [Streptomyces katrae]|nr:hypothetical protein [Streptomyces katrae]
MTLIRWGLMRALRTIWQDFSLHAAFDGGAGVCKCVDVALSGGRSCGR